VVKAASMAFWFAYRQVEVDWSVGLLITNVAGLVIVKVAE
jgi:hypothetical protein